MMWELLSKGTLPPWEFLVFVLCVLALAVGPVAIWLVWPWRRGDADETLPGEASGS